jgi:hypothetical protein
MSCKATQVFPEMVTLPSCGFLRFDLQVFDIHLVWLNERSLTTILQFQ